MKLVEADNGYVINDTEYFYNLNSPSYHPTTILAYVPKLMPNIKQGAPAYDKKGIPTDMFCNSKKEYPISPAKIVTTQNYLTITKPANLSPSFWKTSVNGRMIKNKKHILKVTNRDIRKLEFIEDN